MKLVIKGVVVDVGLRRRGLENEDGLLRKRMVEGGRRRGFMLKKKK
ncbi:hypothetical protein L195_g007474 [Trifolium pratense]|uniref:Uncharacterized protein n=1 Tax=Trifolium pratense TaxID=57577 RepID=A0A2K3P6H5_TRIPR|nr:hypothetical protein L195_g007474 [Trifolium pratense]